MTKITKVGLSVVIVAFLYVIAGDNEGVYSDLDMTLYKNQLAFPYQAEFEYPTEALMFIANHSNIGINNHTGSSMALELLKSREFSPGSKEWYSHINLHLYIYYRLFLLEKNNGKISIAYLKQTFKFEKFKEIFDIKSNDHFCAIPSSSFTEKSKTSKGNIIYRDYGFQATKSQIDKVVLTDSSTNLSVHIRNYHRVIDSVYNYFGAITFNKRILNFVTIKDIETDLILLDFIKSLGRTDGVSLFMKILKLRQNCDCLTYLTNDAPFIFYYLMFRFLSSPPHQHDSNNFEKSVVTDFLSNADFNEIKELKSESTLNLSEIKINAIKLLKDFNRELEEYKSDERIEIILNADGCFLLCSNN